MILTTMSNRYVEGLGYCGDCWWYVIKTTIRCPGLRSMSEYSSEQKARAAGRKMILKLESQIEAAK